VPAGISPDLGRLGATVGGVGLGEGEGDGDAEAADGDSALTPGKQVDAHHRNGHHGGRRDEELGEVVHVSEPPRRPPGTALLGVVDLVERREQGAFGVLVGVFAKPGHDGAGSRVVVGRHRTASESDGRSSASSEARIARIA
jgi:hypothetical protein